MTGCSGSLRHSEASKWISANWQHTLRGYISINRNPFTRHGLGFLFFIGEGKHAFSPLPVLFELLPSARTATEQGAGSDGLTLPEWYKAKGQYDHKTNEMVRAYQQRYHRFTPSFEFVPYELAEQENLFVSWKSLYEEIPDRIEAELATIRHTLAGLKKPSEG